MSDKSVIAVIEAANNPLDIFLNFDGQIRQHLDSYAADIRSVVIDATTKKGREQGKSFVHSIRKEKAACKKVGDEVAKAIKEMPKKVDESRRILTRFFDDLIEEKYAPIAEWEKAEAERIEKAQQEAAEQARIESEAKAKAESERVANVEHRRAINNAAAASLEKLGFSAADAKKIIIAIANGEIANVTINY